MMSPLAWISLVRLTYPTLPHEPDTAQLPENPEQETKRAYQNRLTYHDYTVVITVI